MKLFFLHKEMERLCSGEACGGRGWYLYGWKGNRGQTRRERGQVGSYQIVTIVSRGVVSVYEILYDGLGLPNCFCTITIQP